MFTFLRSQLLTQAPTLFYHTPDLHRYDVQWEVTDWNVSWREVVLDKEVKHETPRWRGGRVVPRLACGWFGLILS